MISDEDRCEATYPLPGESGVVTEMLRCTRHRLHVDAPIGYQEPGVIGRRIYLLAESRPHLFTFEVES